jgi:hypothetical protein
MFFEDNNIKLKLDINEDMRPMQPQKKPKRQVVTPKNKYVAQVEATLRINEDLLKPTKEKKGTNAATNRSSF